MIIALIAKILLTILKVLLFLFLAVILVLLLILCLVMFTPLKYSASAEKYDIIKAEGKVSWLLGIIHVSFLYNDGKSSYKLRIFGADYKKLADFLAKRAKKKEKKTFDFESAEQTFEDEREGNKNEKKKEDQVFPQEEEEPVYKEHKPLCEKGTPPGKKEKMEEKEDRTEAEGRHKKNQNDIQHSQDSRTGKDKRSGNAVISSIKAFWQKIKAIPSKIKDTFSKIGSSIKKARESARNTKDKFTKVKDFVFSEITKNMLGVAKDSLFRLLLKLKPRKIKSDILFGTGDPCQTGQILGLAAVYMAVAGTEFNITPDFENKVLRGRIMVSGQIRAASMAFAVLRVIISNEWKSFYKEAMKIKEEF
ncbi:MAG: DUF2953 domain-containing protein [Lachnospiraceae bacterium]|nr:DUF2953 domain-containing protein [Lachnospiraceae bacterium]